MTLGEKFKSSSQFINYVETTLGLALVDVKAEAFYNDNMSMRFTYTGIIKSLRLL